MHLLTEALQTIAHKKNTCRQQGGLQQVNMLYLNTQTVTNRSTKSHGHTSLGGKQGFPFWTASAVAQKWLDTDTYGTEQRDLPMCSYVRPGSSALPYMKTYMKT